MPLKFGGLTDKISSLSYRAVNFFHAVAAATQFHFHRPQRSPSAPVIRALFAVLVCLGFARRGRAEEIQVLHGHVPAAVAAGLAPVGRLPETQRLNLAFALPLRNQPALTDLLERLYDPSSPRYHQYLTTAQFTAEFGPTRQDYEAVAAFAKAHRLTVTNRYPNRLVLDVNGTVSDIEEALHVTMRVYRHPTEARNFFAPDREPSLDLGVQMSHIGGLNNYALPKPCFKRMPVPPAPAARPNTGSGPGGSYMGYDFRSAYAPGVMLTGSGQTIGLLEFDGYTASDISSYETAAGLPTVSLTNVLLDSFNGAPSSSDGPVEVSLDIEMDVSMAPGASQIIVYEAGPSGNFDDILNRMVSDNLARQISSSWSIPGQGDNTAADTYFQEMATQGQSFFQASGDSDAYTHAIPFPCDNPYITEVGGTTLTDTGIGGSWSSETVWNWGDDNGTYYGSGGGISPTYSIPSWQKGISMTASKGSTTKRNVPDVALTANNVDVEEGGAAYNVGGTSCAAPLWAAFTALVNQQASAAGKSTVGFINPAIYAIGAGSSYSTDFHDITTGNNFSNSSPSKFSAVTGYDLCTGLGTPAGAPLINALAPVPASLDVSPVTPFTSSGPLGGPFTPSTYNYSLTNPGTASSLTWTASATPGWLTLSATSGALAASGSTTVTVSINTGANALTSGTYSGAISFTYVSTGSVRTIPVTLTVQTPYATWQSEMFTASQLANPAISGDTADPAGDGISNLIKYALNLNPWTTTVTGLPAGSIVATGTGNYLALTYTQVISATDLTYTVQVSSDLQTWVSGSNYTTAPVATINPGGVTQTVTVQAAAPMSSGAPAQFIRLQVTGP